MDQSKQHAFVPIARLLAGVTLCMGMAACDASSVTLDEALTNAIGVPGQVVYVTNSLAGGQRRVDSLVIDSASGRWSESQCGPKSATGAPCAPEDFQTVTRTMESFMRDPLFERARRSDFQKLRRDYRRTGEIPPDVVTHLLQIVQNGRRRTVSWESGAAVPPAVESYLCWLLAARGALILCAE